MSIDAEIKSIVKEHCFRKTRNTIEKYIVEAPEYRFFPKSLRLLIQLCMGGFTYFYNTADFYNLKKIYTWLLLKHKGPVETFNTLERLFEKNSETIKLEIEPIITEEEHRLIINRLNKVIFKRCCNCYRLIEQFNKNNDLKSNKLKKLVNNNQKSNKA